MNGPCASLVDVVVSDGARVGIAPCLGRKGKGGRIYILTVFDFGRGVNLFVLTRYNTDIDIHACIM